VEEQSLSSSSAQTVDTFPELAIVSSFRLWLCPVNQTTEQNQKCSGSH
jgi:hypothetical protein